MTRHPGSLVRAEYRPRTVVRATATSAPAADAAPEVGRVVLVDASTLAGWRRSSPSLGQLHQGVLHLLAQHRDERVAVLADPALKHQLSLGEQEDFDADIASGLIVCAPAGSIKGADGFFEAVAARAERDGKDVVVISDRAYGFGRLVPLRRDGKRWVFDLEGATAREGTASRARRSTRRRR